MAALAAGAPQGLVEAEADVLIVGGADQVSRPNRSPAPDEDDLGTLEADLAVITGVCLCSTILSNSSSRVEELAAGGFDVEAGALVAVAAESAPSTPTFFSEARR